MLITKSQAQEILGGSERKIERLVKSGKLPVAHYEKGARKPTPFFNQADVESLKDEALNPSVAALSTETDTTTDESDKTTKRQNDNPSNHALVKAAQPFRLGQTQETSELTARLVEALETLAAQSDKAQSVKTTLPLSDLSVKLLLTLPECSALTGLSRATIKAVIDAESLPAKQMGKAWRVKRADLEQWIKSL